MDSLDVLWMIVSPSPSHPFGLDVVGHNLVVIREGHAADCTRAVLLDNLSVQQLPHLGWRPKFPVSPRVVRIFDALNTKLKSAFLPRLLATAAEEDLWIGQYSFRRSFMGMLLCDLHWYSFRLSKAPITERDQQGPVHSFRSV